MIEISINKIYDKNENANLERGYFALQKRKESKTLIKMLKHK